MSRSSRSRRGVVLALAGRWLRAAPLWSLLTAGVLAAAAGVPVALLTHADTVRVTPAEYVHWELGDAALRLADAGTSGRPVEQSADGRHAVEVATDGTAAGAVRAVPAGAVRPAPVVGRLVELPEPVRSLLPTDARALVERYGEVILADGSTVPVHEVDYAHPITTGMLRQERGAEPVEPGQVVLSRTLAQRLGAAVGGRVELTGGRTLRVAGVVVDPLRARAEFVVAAPGAVLGGRGGPRVRGQSWLVATGVHQGWDEVRRLNRAGWVAQSRPVLLDPPPAGQVPYERLTTEPGVTVAGPPPATPPGRAWLVVPVLLGAAGVLPLSLLLVRRATPRLSPVRAAGVARRQLVASVLVAVGAVAVVADLLGVAGGIGAGLGLALRTEAAVRGGPEELLVPAGPVAVVAAVVPLLALVLAVPAARRAGRPVPTATPPV